MFWTLRGVSFVWAVTLASLALGQQAHPVDASGKIVEMAPGLITVKTIANQVLFCSLDPARQEGNIKLNGLANLSVEVNGQLSIADLAKGMLVRFTIELDNRKQVGDVTDVAVLGFTAPPNLSLGMVPEAGEVIGKAKKPVSGKFIVVGSIESARGGFLEVEFPGGKQRAKLAAEATATLNAGDLSFARVGDDIRVEGAYIALPRVHASKVIITRAKAEGPAKPMRNVPMPIGRPTKKGPEKEGPGGFGVGDPQANPAAAPMVDAAKPKQKGKIVKVN